MISNQIFCSACDRSVRVVMTEDATLIDGEANIPDPELVCLGVGADCRGGVCPVVAQPATVMFARLARFDPENPKHRRVRTRCSGCDTEQSLIVVDEKFAICPECRAATYFGSGVPG